MSDVDHERRAVELVMGSTQYAETLDALTDRIGRTHADRRDDSRPRYRRIPSRRHIGCA